MDKFIVLIKYLWEDNRMKFIISIILIILGILYLEQVIKFTWASREAGILPILIGCIIIILYPVYDSYIKSIEKKGLIEKYDATLKIFYKLLSDCEKAQIWEKLDNKGNEPKEVAEVNNRLLEIRAMLYKI